jgi:hypothetical protein
MNIPAPKILYLQVGPPTQNGDFFEKASQSLIKYWYVGFEVLTAVVMESTIFWDMTPCSPLSANRPTFMLVSGSAYFSTLKMEAISSSETSFDSQLTIRSYIPEDGTLLNFSNL